MNPEVPVRVRLVTPLEEAERRGSGFMTRKEMVRLHPSRLIDRRGREVRPLLLEGATGRAQAGLQNPPNEVRLLGRLPIPE